MILIEAVDADYETLLAGRAPDGLRLPDGGVERPEVLTMLRDLANTIRPVFCPAAWLIVDGQEVVGLCSLVRSPTPEGVDIGYGIAQSRRRRGFARAAVAALLDWAREDDRVCAVKAETAVQNIPSQRVLERNGFERIGERLDPEDGELLCWRAATKL